MKQTEQLKQPSLIISGLIPLRETVWDKWNKKGKFFNFSEGTITFNKPCQQ